jgi:endonuclease YncB( thermonuclease family)
MTTIGSSLGRCRLLAPLALMTIAAGPPDEGRILYVHDGDTFRLESGERIRIAGIDAPETDPRQAKCPGEVALGKAAGARARALIDRRDVTLVRVGRSYKRTVARVSFEGRDLATLLVDGGVALWWPRGKFKPDWCAANGCDGRVT